MHTQTDDAFVLGRLFSVLRLALVAESPASTTLPENAIFNKMKKCQNFPKQVNEYKNILLSRLNK